jgi:hypothetical protein
MVQARIKSDEVLELSVDPAVPAKDESRVL